MYFFRAIRGRCTIDAGIPSAYYYEHAVLVSTLASDLGLVNYGKGEARPPVLPWNAHAGVIHG